MRRRSPTNYALLFPYAAPYFAYVFSLTLVPNLVPESWDAWQRTLSYVVAGAAAAVGLVWAWRWTLPLRGEGSVAGSIGVGLGGGLVGTALWVALKAPFYQAGGEVWSASAFWLRFLVSATVVAVFEELVFRGLLMRAAYQWWEIRRGGTPHALSIALHERSVDQVPAGAWSFWAVAISSLLFAVGHAPREFLAAFGYGLWMAALVVYRKDLLTAVIAHGTTNAVLAIYVRETGNWNYW